MEKFFKYKWAVDGETTAVPNAIDPSGFVSYRQGYGADYSRVYGTDPLAKAPERVKLNAVLQDITSELQSLQVHGFPEYITSALNDGSPYAYDIGAIVRWTDNKNYRNTVALNDDGPDTAGWVLYNDPADAINSATAKTTPIGADKLGIYDSVSGLLRSVSFTKLWDSLSGLFAPLSSPAFTDTPTAPTAPAGTNTTQVATTEFVKAKSELDSIGVGQTWQNPPGGRALATNYTNNTGKPIMIAVVFGTSGTSTANLQINGLGVVWAQTSVSASLSSSSFQFIIPNGSSYQVTNSAGGLTSWIELR